MAALGSEAAARTTMIPDSERRLPAESSHWISECVLENYSVLHDKHQLFLIFNQFDIL
jgi:hypothetical protein